MDEKAFCYSRCSMGKNKWFWVVETLDDYFSGKDPFSFGYAATAEEAETQALAAAKNKYPEWNYRQVQAYTAWFFKRCLVAKEKAKKQSKSTTTSQVEYLHADHCSDFDGEWYSIKHCIVKKTAKRVYVNWDGERPYGDRHYGDWQDFAYRELFVLDREELEREGSAWSRRKNDRYYTTPYEERCVTNQAMPECGKLLGLTAPWTTNQVKQAFPCLVKKAHSDAGGNGEEFKKVYQAYKEALAIATDRVSVMKGEATG